MAEFKVIDDIYIRTNDRIAVFGKTGSGKTHLVKNWLLPHYGKYVFWDVKHENNDVEHDIITKTHEQLKANIKKYNKILHQPTSPEPYEFDAVCEVVFEHKDVTLYVDEASRVTNPSRIEYWHNVIMTQGRTYNVGIINASQRPRAIHNTLISESEHLFIFHMTLETDIVKMRQQIGSATDEIRYLPEYHFLYHNVRSGKSYIFKPVKPLGLEKVEETSPLETYKPSLEEYITLISQREG